MFKSSRVRLHVLRTRVSVAGTSQLGHRSRLHEFTASHNGWEAMHLLLCTQHTMDQFQRAAETTVEAKESQQKGVADLLVRHRCFCQAFSCDIDGTVF